jgi:hypothetical protein
MKIKCDWACDKGLLLKAAPEPRRRGRRRMYVTIFDKYMPLWNELPIRTRAAIVGVSIVATTILFGAVAVLTHHHYDYAIMRL